MGIIISCLPRASARILRLGTCIYMARRWDIGVNNSHPITTSNTIIIAKPIVETLELNFP